MPRAKRKAEVSRKTAETQFRVRLALDGKGEGRISTGIGFFDHMLEQVAKHGMIDLTVEGEGDLGVDSHHTVEDVGLLIGQALREALGDRAGIQRYGSALLPMMDALAWVALDLGGRPNLVFRASFPERQVGELDTALVREFFFALASQAGADLHIQVPYGEDAHHMVEAIFKGFARALRAACAPDQGRRGVPSTKGTL